MKFHDNRIATICKQSCVLLLQCIGCIVIARNIRRKILKKKFIGILAYHHIGTGPMGLISPSATTPETFRRQAGMFSKKFRVLLMREAADFIGNQSTPPEDSVVFTFDDGYEDSFEWAAPILEEAGIRGVFYITGQTFTRGRLLWNDILGIVAQYAVPGDFDNCRIEPKEVKQLFQAIAVSGKKEKADLAIKAFNRLLDEDQGFRDTTCRLLENILYNNKMPINRNRVLMDEEQVVDLAHRGHEIGAHTLTHSRLSHTGDCAQREIVESIAMLRRRGIAVSSFAYPFGRKSDWNVSIIEVLQRAGISNAVTVENNYTMTSINPFLLPRICMAPYHSAAFAALRFELSAWRSIFNGIFQHEDRGRYAKRPQKNRSFQ